MKFENVDWVNELSKNVLVFRFVTIDKSSVFVFG